MDTFEKDVEDVEKGVERLKTLLFLLLLLLIGYVLAGPLLDALDTAYHKEILVWQI